MFDAIRYRNYGIRKDREGGDQTSLHAQMIFFPWFRYFSFDLDQIRCSETHSL